MCIDAREKRRGISCVYFVFFGGNACWYFSFPVRKND